MALLGKAGIDIRMNYEVFVKFRKQVTKWGDISEREYLNIR